MTLADARRFYTDARAVDRDGAFSVMLDARGLKTRRGAPFKAPTRALAEACAGEWEAQREHIVFAAMPLTRLAFEAIDLTDQGRADYASLVAAYGETDLCCHRAPGPEDLIAREAAARQPLVDWAARDLDVVLTVMSGVQAAPPNPAAIVRLRAHAAACDDFRLVALAQAAKLSGSALIALALAHRRLDAEAAYQAAALDELWSLERWGEDTEARARLDRLRDDFAALGRFLDALARQ